MSSFLIRSITRSLLWAGLLICLVADSAGFAQAQARRPARSETETAEGVGQRRDYRSKNFVLHTDIGSEAAKDLLDQLETMLQLISRYWGQPNRKIIECYVVQDLRNWPPGKIPGDGAQSISQGAGITITQVWTRGKSFSAKATVYAAAGRQITQHEAVHAYCAQVFGRTGPVWYSEGMADMGAYWQEDNRAVNCPDYVVRYLHRSEPKSLNDIVNSQELTGDSWQNYAWRWALCHLLANNPNYSARFRPLGLGLLTNQETSFEDVYGSMAEEISFEYLFFLKHFDRGYRVDLCSWNWKTPFRSPTASRPLSATILADHGWQPTRVTVRDDRSYEYSATGAWATKPEQTPISADGSEDGSGRLVGIVLDADYELSEPFELGTSGSFTPTKSGKLFARCRDAWNELADNTGSIKLRIGVQP